MLTVLTPFIHLTVGNTSYEIHTSTRRKLTWTAAVSPFLWILLSVLDVSGINCPPNSSIKTQWFYRGAVAVDRKGSLAEPFDTWAPQPCHWLRSRSSGRGSLQSLFLSQCLS